MCKVKDCDRVSKYKSQDVCQMHYFRYMRNGVYNTIRTHRDKYTSDNGYVFVRDDNHRFVNKSGYVEEHRKVFYEANKDKELSCEFCGKFWDWRPHKDHIDHIDEVRGNNNISNLRALCNGCNTKRTKVDYASLERSLSVTWRGETKTPEEWGRDHRIPAKGYLIRQRLSRGMSIEDAFFMEKLTYNGKLPKKKPIPPPKHTRKNSYAITIDGVTKTPSEWSRHPQCGVSDGTIRTRLKKGLAHEECVFGNGFVKNY
jgi:5-methylcytosine-specific restriction endonuclease McrA